MKKKILLVFLLVFASIYFTACSAIDLSSFKYKIDFMVDGKIYDTIGTNGATIKMPKDPVKNNYDFKGWFWDDGIWNEPFTINSIMDQPIQETNDYKVYAKFVSDIYVVKYIAGTSEIIEDVNVKKNTKLNMVVPNIVKPKHVFDGWYKDSEFKEKWNFDTDKVQNNMNLYAKWIERELAIELKGFSYDGFNYTLPVSNNTLKIDLSDKIIVKNNAPYTIHKNISGNNITDIKNIELKEEGDNVFYLEINGNSIYGIYYLIIRRKPIYTVSFVTNGGTFIPDQKVEEGGTFIKPQDPIKENFIFLGWSAPETTEIFNNITIGAYWKGVNVRINLDANGGELNDTYLDVEYYSYVKLPYPKKDGYAFIGWYDGETNIQEGYWYFAEEKFLCAKWRIAEFNISYILNEGTNNTANKEKYTMLDDDIILYEPLKKGYKFLVGI